MRLARGVVWAVLAALVWWPSVAVAQTTPTDPEAQPGSDSGTGAGSDASADRATCDEAPAVFALLCASYDLVMEQFVDDVSDEALASAATRGVLDAELAPREELPAPVCVLPAPAFEQACQAIDAVADTSAAVWAASSEMFASLDDAHTHLMSAREYENLQSRLNASSPYSGIGLSLGLLDGTVACHALSDTCRPVVAEVFADSPAESAGLMPDDIVVAFDDYVPAGSGCGLGGLGGLAVGRLVVVQVIRDGVDMTFEVEAGLVHTSAVHSRMVASSTGYLRLDSFGNGTAASVARELRDLLDAGAETLVIDLRGNPGGYLDAVIAVASLFLEDDQVVIEEVSKVETLRHLVSGHGGLPEPAVLPIAVVVDGSSASASEVLTLALRDHGLATVVGTTTYGKNTGQVIRGVESSDGTLLGGARITVFRWLGPDGQSASGGIVPDVALDVSGCWHPLGLTRQAASAAGLPGAVAADIELGTEHFAAVAALTRDGVLAGVECAPGLFCPGDPTSRWQMAVWLVRMLDGTDPAAVDASRFADVDPSQWWATHVERLAELGITQGCASEPAEFCPAEAVTRAQMATFLNRAFMLDAASSQGFTDTGEDVHAAAIDALYASGVSLGCSAEPLMFCPADVTSRGQMALFLQRARSLSAESGS